MLVSTEKQSTRPQLLFRCAQGRQSPATHGPAGLHSPALRTEAEPRLPGPTPRCSSGPRGRPARQALLALDWDAATLQEEPENPACDLQAGPESDRTLQTVPEGRTTSERTLRCAEGKTLHSAVCITSHTSHLPREGDQQACCSKHGLHVTVGSDPMIQRKSTLNLNVNTEIEDVRLFSGMTSAFLFVLAGSLYITHSPLLSKTKQEREDNREVKS